MHCNRTKEREILDRYLRPIVEQFEKKISRPDIYRRVFFFLYPPTPGKEFDSVRYYGLASIDGDTTPSHAEDVRHASNLFEDAYRAMFRGLPEGTRVNFEQFPGFIRKVILDVEDLLGGDRTRAFGALRAVAREILTGASVGIRRSTEDRSATPILLAHAFDMANTDYSDGAPTEVREHTYPGAKFCSWFIEARGPGQFSTNADFTHGEPDPEPDCTFLITKDYLTRSDYLIGYLVPDPHGDDLKPEGTFRAFAAECLFTLDEKELPINDLDTLTTFLSSLRQIHLPVAAMGQYRGSVCWISYDGFRSSLARSRLAREFDRHFQGIIAEFFSLAMIDVFEAMVGEALRLLVPGRDETWKQFEKKFYTQIGTAFSYLIGSQKIDFIGQDSAGNGRVVSYLKGDVIFLPSPSGDATPQGTGEPAAFIAIDRAGNPAEDGTEVTFHLERTAGGSNADGISAKSVIETLRCDRVRCHAYFVTDHGRLSGHGAMIHQAICRQVEHYIKDKTAQRDSISSLFTHGMTNLFRELDLKRSSRGLSRIMPRISGHLQPAESAVLEVLRIKLSQVDSIVRRLQRQRDLWKMAEDGELEATWRGPGGFTSRWLEQWRMAIRKLILNYVSSYNSLLRLEAEDRPAEDVPTIAAWEMQAESRELQRIMDFGDPGIIGDPGWLGIDLPPFDSQYTDEGFLMATMALEEIVRNPLKMFYDEAYWPIIMGVYGSIFLVFAITFEQVHGHLEVLVRMWNPFYNEFDVETGSRSLKLIREDMRGLHRFAKVGLMNIVGLDEIPFNLPAEIKADPGIKLVESRFSVAPGLFFD